MLAILVTCLCWGRVPSVWAATPALAVTRATLPASLCPGEGQLVELTIRNDTAEPWVPALGDRLAYHWLDDRGKVVVRDGLRTELPRRIEPGEELRLQARLQAPGLAEGGDHGSHHLQWAVVREGVQWYPAAATTFEVEVAGAADSGRPAFAWAAQPVDVPLVFVAGERHDATWALKNLGCAAWDGERGDAITYHWYDREGRLAVREGVRTPLPPVAVGETREVTTAVVAPSEPGTYVLVPAALREQVAWWEPHDLSAVRVEVIASRQLAWSLVDAADVQRLRGGEQTRIWVRIRNEGEDAWAQERGDQLSYRWLDPDTGDVLSEGLRTPWPHDVAPGEVVEVEARVMAPHGAGEAVLVWEPVREGVRWYGPPVSGTADAWRLEAPTTIEPPALAWSVLGWPDGDTPRMPLLWAGVPVQMPIRVRNDGTQPWSAESGDRLSYRWSTLDGTPLTDEGVRSALVEDVRPGEEVEVDLRIRPPSTPGTYVLSISPVREGVQWFSAPETGESRFVVRVHRRLHSVVALFFALCGLCGAALGSWREPWRSRLAGFVWPLWLAFAMWTLDLLFDERGDIVVWSGHEAVVLSSCAGLFAAVMLLPRRWQGTGAFAVALTCTALVLADLAYLRFFGTLVPIEALAAVHHLGDTTASIGSLLERQDAWLAAVPIGALPVWLGMRRRPVDAASLSPRFRIAAVGMGLLAASLAITTVVDAIVGEIGRRVFSEHDNAGRFGVLAAHAAQTGRAVMRLGARLQASDEVRAEVADYFAARMPPPPGRPTGENVIAIQVEALQLWVLGAVVDGQEITPFLNRAHEQAAVFTGVYDQTAQGRTSDAEYLMLSSAHPLGEGALAFLRAGNDFDTVAHALRRAGYTTLSAHPFAAGFWNRSMLHPQYGFERSLFREALGHGPSVGWGLSDDAFLQRMHAHLGALSEPFFAFLITLSLHHPYDSFPSELAVLDLGALEGTALGNYLHAMNHFDRALEAFMRTARTTSWGRRSVVLVYGDHAAGLPIDGSLATLAGASADDPHLRLDLHRVPVVLFTPDARLVGHRDVVGGHIDLGPTLLDVVDVSPPRAFVGRSLLRDDDHAVLPDGTVIGPEVFAVGPRMGAVGCYERATGRSAPAERCRALRETGERELDVARSLLDFDLHRDVQ